MDCHPGWGRCRDQLGKDHLEHRSYRSGPEGASIVVEARASDNQADIQNLNYTAINNGADFHVTGRYLQTRVTLTANTNSDSPVLSDITIRPTVVAVGDFTPTTDRTEVTVSRGQSTTVVVTLQPFNNFNQPVELYCSGMPKGTSWSFSPATVTPTNGGAVTSTMTISRAEHHRAAAPRRIALGRSQPLFSVLLAGDRLATPSEAAFCFAAAGHHWFDCTGSWM